MNILMALSQLEITGAEVYATTIADELIERGNKVYIVSDTLTTPTKAEYIKLEFNKRSLIKRIEHIKFLYKLIKEKDIQIVHAHSRASSWSCQVACKLAGIPLITTTHGRQPIHFSRKLIKAFGDYSIAVCENIKKHMVNDIGKLVLGYNEDFQKKSNIGSINNQNFVNIPYGKLRDKIIYLSKLYGIEFKLQEESYTSKASFFDGDEIPIYDKENPQEYIFSGKRIKRGLYQTSAGKFINADCNGALNILRKSKVVDLSVLYNRGELNTPKRIRVV